MGFFMRKFWRSKNPFKHEILIKGLRALTESIIENRNNFTLAAYVDPGAAQSRPIAPPRGRTRPRELWPPKAPKTKKKS